VQLAFVQDASANAAFVHDAFVHEAFVHEAFVHEAFVHDAFVQDAFVHDALAPTYAFQALASKYGRPPASVRTNWSRPSFGFGGAPTATEAVASTSPTTSVSRGGRG